MAFCNFTGIVDSLSERQLEFISGVLRDLGYKDENVSLEQVGLKGDNYLSTVLRLSIGKIEEVKRNIIAKVAPRHDAVRTMVNTHSVFNNEVIMYTEVLPKFVELQRRAGIFEEDLLKYPKCYGTLMEQPDELILLEDLTVSSYGIQGRLKDLTNDNIKSVLRTLANLHSCSFCLKQQDNELYNTYSKQLVNTWILLDSNPETKIHLKQLEEDVLSILDDDKPKEIIRGKIENMASYMSARYSPDQDSKFLVIQQGDCWTNNLMFKTKGGKIVDNIMIDYQMSKQSSPVDDILYLIFSCTDHETRKTHYHAWLDYYYSDLSERLHKFGLDADTVYPKTEMLNDLKRNAKFLLGQGFMLASVLSREQVETLDLTESIIRIENNPSKTKEEYRITRLGEKSLTRLRSRVKGLVDSYLELGMTQDGV